MSAVRFVFPKLRLAEILKTPGGLTVADALERAQANLDTLKPSCVAELVALLELADAAFERLGPVFDDAALTDLYAIAVRGIGAGAVCGTPAIDQALTSLCDLIDHLRTTGHYDRAAVGVHLRAWRLLMNPDLPDAGVQRVLDGLRKVAARYAA
ncbi:hypothetical protein ACO2Q0_07550 [Phenylobacterium sp. VNQ135]|uniref:hypothetical protein n=1 Tax=Phenylobacterium sp. VNQ135 TaxID=3400922 RepID=UPI003C02BB97